MAGILVAAVVVETFVCGFMLRHVYHLTSVMRDNLLLIHDYSSITPRRA